MKKFEVINDCKNGPGDDMKAGTIVYDSKGYDYGCANDDTYVTGVEHISVTYNEDGDYPFFTIAKHLLKEV